MALQNFQVRYETPKPGQNVILFSGPITEKSDLANVRIPLLPPETSLYIDTGGVSMLNSIGTRDFANWIRALKDVPIVFRHCPKIFIDQLNMMPGFIPVRSVVASFYVPFATVDVAGTDFDEKHLLYSYPTNYRRENGRIVFSHIQNLTDKNSQPMELDVVPEKYFRFLDLYCPKGTAVS